MRSVPHLMFSFYFAIIGNLLEIRQYSVNKQNAYFGWAKPENTLATMAITRQSTTPRRIIW